MSRKKVMENHHSKKVAKPHGKAAQEMRKERKSATGMSGAPKKGGCGGKFTWSGDLINDLRMENGAIDEKDPNFEESA